MSEPQPTALAKLTAHNQITVVADLDHTSDDIKARIAADLPAMAANGVKHLFLEHDARDVSPDDIVSDGGAYASLLQTARELGISIHMMDDRSRQRDRATRFAEEDAQRLNQDPYMLDTEGLIARAQNPEKMQEYVKEIEINERSDMEFRNVRMVENIDDEMRNHGDEKAVVVTGGTHTFGRSDIDEGLRLRGYQTATAQIFAADMAGDGLIFAAGASDKADVTLRADTGEASSYKVPGTNLSRRVETLPHGSEIPWENQEPVADRNHPWMLCALDAAKGVNCSWNHATATTPIEASTEKTRQMTSPSTERRAAGAEVGSPPR